MMKINSRKIVQVKNLTVRYSAQEKAVLNNLQIDIEKGNHLAIIGASGCGKSTFAKSLVQMLPLNTMCDGQILINGKDPTLLNQRELQIFRRNSFGYIYQDAIKKLNPLMTIGEHLTELLQLHFEIKSRVLITRMLEEILDKVGLDPKRSNSYPHEFSGGMRQRVSIAMALALKPPLLIADEPTTSLDTCSSFVIMNQLLSLCKEYGSTLILISHDISLAKKWCKKLAIIDQGIIQEQGEIENIFKNPVSRMGKILVKANSTDLIKNSTIDKAPKKIILEVHNLRYWYKLNYSIIHPQWNKALNEVSFNLYEKEILGIVGISGCGKSTLSRVLSGLIKSRGGYFHIKNNPNEMLERKTILNAKSIQMIFQDPFSSLNPMMNIKQILEDICLIHKITNKNKILKLIKATLSSLNLPTDTKFMNSYPSNLSGGQLQRIAMARALLIKPRILICDESVNMLDAYVKIEILCLLKAIQKKMNLSIIFITHDLGLANKFCDRLIVMDKGKVVESGCPLQIFNSPQHSTTKKLINSSLNI